MNRNWQLVFIQVGMAIVSSLGFFLITGISLAVVLIALSIDLTEFLDLEHIFRILQNPSEMISRYLGFILSVLTSIFLYVIIVSILAIYVLCGIIGILGNCLKERSFKFTMQVFFSEAKRLFFSVFGFIIIMGIIISIAGFIFVLLGGRITAFISNAKSQDSNLLLFVSTFFFLILVLIALILILGILSITVYGIASLFFKGTGPLKSIKEASYYVIRHPHALWFYIILFVGYLFVSLFLILISYPFIFLPIVGTILSFPYQIVSYVIEIYLGLTIIAAILTYYHSSEMESDSIVETSSFKNNTQGKTK